MATIIAFSRHACQSSDPYLLFLELKDSFLRRWSLGLLAAEQTGFLTCRCHSTAYFLHFSLVLTSSFPRPSVAAALFASNTVQLRLGLKERTNCDDG